MADEDEDARSGYNKDLPRSHYGYDSDWDVGADHYGGAMLAGKDPVELAKKWGSNPGGGTRKRKRGPDSEDKEPE